MNERAKKILEFWFIKSSIKDWFEKNDNFDKKIRDLFLEDYNQAINNEYDDWQDNPNECVALVILLDQFSRNLFRNNKKAFHQDYKTRLIVNEAVDRGYLEELDLDKIHFLLLPLIHSEDISDHIFGHKLIENGTSQMLGTRFLDYRQYTEYVIASIIVKKIYLKLIIFLE